MDRRIGLVSLALCLSLAAPRPAAATTVVCTVNNGNINGRDSSTWGGLDNPDNVDDWYSPSNSWHDASIKEWCFPPQHYDQFRDDFLKWSATAVNAVTAANSGHNLEVEQDVYPDNSYNANSEWIDSDLNWTWHFVSNVPEQVDQHFEESWIVVGNPKTIVANVNYHVWQQWLQEADGQFLDGSPLLSKVISKIEWTDDIFNNLDIDKIGQMKKNVANNS